VVGFGQLRKREGLDLDAAQRQNLLAHLLSGAAAAAALQNLGLQLRPKLGRRIAPPTDANYVASLHPLEVENLSGSGTFDHHHVDPARRRPG
jgi:hypothetical protein